MKRLLGYACMSLLMIFCSCQENKKESSGTTEELQPAPVSTATDSLGSVQQNLPAGIVTADTGQSTTTVVTPGNESTALNPAHGQPGHRCDIAVGAPLNSPPGNMNAAAPTIINDPVTQGSPAIQVNPANSNSSIQVQPPTATAPGMNPPHGQPGHDCSIAVGAPLKK